MLFRSSLFYFLASIFSPSASSAVSFASLEPTPSLPALSCGQVELSAHGRSTTFYLEAKFLLPICEAEDNCFNNQSSVSRILMFRNPPLPDIKKICASVFDELCDSQGCLSTNSTPALNNNNTCCDASQSYPSRSACSNTQPKGWHFIYDNVCPSVHGSPGETDIEEGVLGTANTQQNLRVRVDFTSDDDNINSTQLFTFELITWIGKGFAQCLQNLTITTACTDPTLSPTPPSPPSSPTPILSPTPYPSPEITECGEVRLEANTNHTTFYLQTAFRMPSRNCTSSQMSCGFGKNCTCQSSLLFTSLQFRDPPTLPWFEVCDSNLDVLCSQEGCKNSSSSSSDSKAIDGSNNTCCYAQNYPLRRDACSLGLPQGWHFIYDFYQCPSFATSAGEEDLVINWLVNGVESSLKTLRIRVDFTGNVQLNNNSTQLLTLSLDPWIGGSAQCVQPLTLIEDCSSDVSVAPTPSYISNTTFSPTTPTHFVSSTPTFAPSPTNSSTNSSFAPTVSPNMSNTTYTPTPFPTNMSLFPTASPAHQRTSSPSVTPTNVPATSAPTTEAPTHTQAPSHVPSLAPTSPNTNITMTPCGSVMLHAFSGQSVFWLEANFTMPQRKCSPSEETCDNNKKCVCMSELYFHSLEFINVSSQENCPSEQDVLCSNAGCNNVSSSLPLNKSENVCCDASDRFPRREACKSALSSGWHFIYDFDKCPFTDTSKGEADLQSLSSLEASAKSLHVRVEYTGIGNSTQQVSFKLDPLLGENALCVVPLTVVSKCGTPSTPNKSSLSMTIIIGLSIGGFIILASIFGYFYYDHRQKAMHEPLLRSSMIQ